MTPSAPTVFRVALITIVGSLLAFNIFTLTAGIWLSLIPIVLQSLLLIALVTRSSRQVVLTRLWAGLLMLMGAAGLVGSCANLVLLSLHSADTNHAQLRPGQVIFSASAFGFSCYVFRKCKGYLLVSGAGKERVATVPNGGGHGA